MSAFWNIFYYIDDDDEDCGIIHIVRYQNNWESVDQNILVEFYQNIGRPLPTHPFMVQSQSWL